jgi:septum formation protein
MNLILASSSIYRQAQLKQLGLPFLCHSPDVDESVLKNQGLDPKALSLKLSELKAQAVHGLYPDCLVIGADQVCSFQSQILSKPVTKNRALEQLTQLQGQTHSLLTSFCVITREKKISHCVEAKLKMRPLDSSEIERYLDQDEPYQCCGSYRLEALGISLFEEIECQDHTSIIGLPLMLLSQTLRSFHFKLP